MVDRTPAATRQLASRARRRIQGAAPDADADLADQRAVVDAFLAAAREGDFEALVAVLEEVGGRPQVPPVALELLRLPVRVRSSVTSALSPPS
jgi:hypothetical protein